MRTRLIPAVLAGLLLLGCTSGDDDPVASEDTAPADDTSDDTTDDTPAEDVPTGPAPGVTDTSVKIGVNIVDTEALAGVITIDTGDVEGAYNALVDDINANGGINGREIELVFTYIDPQSPQPAEDACLRLTEDEDVFATVGFFLGESVLCTVEAHETAVVGGTQSAAFLERAQAPWFALESDQQEDDVIRAFAEAGELDGNVAVMTYVTDGDRLENQVEPLLEELGVNTVATALLDAPPDDPAAVDTAVKAIAQNFEAADADTVLLLGQVPTNWASAMQEEPYRPKLLFGNSTIQAFVVNAETRDKSLLEGSFHGGLYGPDQAVFEEEGMQACLEIVTAAGVEVPAPDTITDGTTPYFGGFDACRHITLLAAILEGAGETLNYGTFQQAGEELGEIQIPGDPEPATFGPDSPDGDVAQHLFAWNAAADAFELSE